MTSSHRPLALVVETREIDLVDDLLAYTSPAAPLAWLRRGDGIVGIGDLGGYESGPADARGAARSESPIATSRRPRHLPAEGFFHGTRDRGGPVSDYQTAASALRCKECERTGELTAAYVCEYCFGPLEVLYDIDVAARPRWPLDEARALSNPTHATGRKGAKS